MDKDLFILNASPEKRYKNFISTVADRSEVWLLSNDDGYASFDDEYINLLIWPTKKFAQMFQDGDVPVSVEIHDFCDRLKEVLSSDEIRFMVFPNGENAFVVDANKLLYDITDELDKIE